jgi:hypothetical protein
MCVFRVGANKIYTLDTSPFKVLKIVKMIKSLCWANHLFFAAIVPILVVRHYTDVVEILPLLGVVICA